MGINNELIDLYHNNWNGFLKMQNILTKEGITDYSSPLLMHCWEQEYLDSNKKILFVGQETNSWFDNGSTLTKDSLNQVISNYEDFELGNGYNSPFWNFVRKLNSKINDSDYSFLWTNVNKFGLSEGAGRPADKVLELENTHFNLLKEELRIIQPDAVIFLTGPNYDKDIKKKLGDTEFVECTSQYTDNAFAQVKNRYLPEKSFRIYHPTYLSYNSATDEYIDILSSLI